MSVLSVQPDATAGIDTYIQSGASAGNNYGVATTIQVAGDFGGSTIRKGLIKFDFSSIPAGATIVSALLTLNLSSELSAAVDPVITFNRSLVAFFEGVNNGSTPGAGVDGSTYSLRNANGSVAWAGGAGGAAGSDYASSPTASQTINGTGLYTWDVAADVQLFVNGTTNNGWWVINTSAATNNSKTFTSSDGATPADRPQIVVTYYFNRLGSAAGTSTASATLKGAGNIDGLAIGSSTASGFAYTNSMLGSSDGTSTASGALGASGRGAGTADGTSTAVGLIRAKGKLIGSSAGTSTGLADGTFAGQLRGASAGTGTAVGLGHVYARSLAVVKGCYSDPLLYLTDGSIKPNGQLNLLSLIDPHIGYLLNNWKPAIAQYKEGGIFSDSPYGTGRRLTKRVFANAIEVFDLKARGHDQDNLISYTSELLNWQEAAADYWTSNWNTLPIYLVAKAAKETNPRYAIVYAMSVPELENPYAQPFSSIGKPAHEQITLRLERGDWTSEPPGSYVCVAVSSQRNYTVAAWGTGA